MPASEDWTGGLPLISEVISKPNMFGLINLTADYHHTPLHAKSRELSAFITVDGLYQWTRVATGPYFQRSMASEILVRLIYRICELYIDDVLIHVATESEFLTRITPVLTSHGSKPEESATVPSILTEDTHSGGTQVTTGYLVADFFPCGRAGFFSGSGQLPKAS